MSDAAPVIVEAWARHRRRRAWLWLVWFSPLIALYGALCLPETWTKLAASRWPVAPARLLRAIADPSAGELSLLGPRVDVDFAYFVGGERFESRQTVSASYAGQIGISPDRFPWPAHFYRRETTAAFDPRHPGRAILERSISRPDSVVFFPLLLTTIAGGCFLVARFRRQPIDPLALDAARNARWWYGHASAAIFDGFPFAEDYDDSDFDEELEPLLGPVGAPGIAFGVRRPVGRWQRWVERRRRWPVLAVRVARHPLRRGEIGSFAFVGQSNRPAKVRVRLMAGPFTVRGRPRDAKWSAVVFRGQLPVIDQPGEQEAAAAIRVPTLAELPPGAIDLWLWIEPVDPPGRGRPLWISAVDGPVTTPGGSV